MTPLSLPQWIQRARVYLTNEDYLECAIIVASELTNRLLHIVGTDTNNTTEPLNAGSISSNSLCNGNRSTNLDSEEKEAGGRIHHSLSLVKIEDIVPENVLVFVTKKKTPDRSSPANHRATDVNIQTSTSASGTPPQLIDPTDTPHISQREACFALGKILFEIFSESSSQFLTEVSSQQNERSIGDLQIGGLLDFDSNSINGENNGNAASAMMGDMGLDDENDDCDDALPALKKAFLLCSNQSETPAKSMKANEYLQAQNLPPSICQLVLDLLASEEGNPYIPVTAILSLQEAQRDLLQIKSFPERLLDCQSCPKKALDKTSLFNQSNAELYGREKELSILMNMAARVCQHAPSLQRNGFLCEAAFIAGHSGSGKSSLTKRLGSYWSANGWSVIFCKFDRQVAPLSILIRSLDAYFERFIPIQVGGIMMQRELSVQESFDRISRSIISSIDSEGFIELCQLLPKFSELFPMSSQYVQQRNSQTGSLQDSLASVIDQSNQVTDASSAGNVGSGRNRLLNLLHVILNAVCRGGKPLLMCVEDLQWADKFTVDIIGDYIIQTAGYYSSVFSAEDESRGIMLLGNFRDDEVPEDGFLMDKIKLLGQSQGNINVTRLSVGELLEREINEMLSFKFCLPTRHTGELAQLVFQKTRGHPLFVIAFLQSIIQGNLITYSIRARRWTWDDTTIDLQMISENVAEFLTKKLRQLHSDVIETLKVASCFGQINLSTVQLLDSGQFVPDMLKSLESAMEEGIIERAGPVYAFSHDMLEESSYNLIPTDQRKTLHKKIAMSLVQDPEVSENADMCTLAVDQINVFKVLGGVLSPSERSLFARLNLAAGKHSMSTKKSNYEQAREYFETGILMLHVNHWDKQYSLSLELFEQSVVVSFMDGILDTVSSRLDEILSNTRSFDDALNSRVLRAKLLASQEQHPAAVEEMCEILSNMGEVFPKEINASLVMSELNEIVPILKGVTKETVLGLPAMTDETKLLVMKLFDLLATFSNFSSPMLMHLVSCRMIKLTFSFGFCGDYSIPALVLISHGLLMYSNANDNIWLATKISRIAVSLMNGNPNEHPLRARLSRLLPGVLMFVEPFQSALQRCLDGCHSAKIVGDTDNEMYLRLLYCSGSLFITMDLVELRKILGFNIQRMAKRNRISILHSSMSFFDAYNGLIGNGDLDVGIEMKTNKELHQIAEQKKNTYLMFQAIMNQICVHLYYREYLSCSSLAENHQNTLTGRRSFDIFMDFYAGISALNLARETKQDKWRKIGEKAVQSMTQLVQYSSWNFENKQLLLQAELNYLNERHTMAELAYESSIVSAKDHKFINEEALAHELFGIYLVENKKVERGIEHLHTAYDRYMQWGAFKKAGTVKSFMELFESVK